MTRGRSGLSGVTLGAMRAAFCACPLLLLGGCGAIEAPEAESHVGGDFAASRDDAMAIPVVDGATTIDAYAPKVGDPSRVVIGIPSYGYSGTTGSANVNRRPYAELAPLPGFASATQLPGGTSYVFVDAEALDAKRAFIASKGIGAISVWHLGGNQWFTK